MRVISFPRRPYAESPSRPPDSLCFAIADDLVGGGVKISLPIELGFLAADEILTKKVKK
jgi:hypothetical protein